MRYFLIAIGQNTHLSLVESGASHDFKVRMFNFSSRCHWRIETVCTWWRRQNYFYLLYCNIVTNTYSVGAIAKVNGGFVFHLSNSKKLRWWVAIFDNTGCLRKFARIRGTVHSLNWNKDSFSFFLEVIDNYIHWNNNILIDNFAKLNVQLWRYHEINYQRVGEIFFFAFLSQNHIIWKEIRH